MHLAFVAPTLGYSGGLERFVFDRATALRARGHRVSLVHQGREGRDPERYRSGFDSVIHQSDWSSLARVDLALVQRATSEDELRWLDGTSTVVFAHDHDLSCPRSHRYVPLGRAPCHRAPGITCVAHGCVVVKDRARQGFALRVVDPFSFRAQTLALSARHPIVACSEYVRRSLLSMGATPERVSVLHPVPPPSESIAIERDSAPTLLVLGSLLRGKGVDIAIDALSRMPKHVRLRVVGEGPERAALEAQAAQLAPGRVEFVGALHPDAVVREIDRAWLMVVPSRWPEPFGMTGIEAMQRARPVVAARHGGIVEWLRDGHGVDGFEPGNARALAEAARRMLGDHRTGELAREWSEQRWRFDRSMDAMESLLERAARANKGLREP
ncbi:MAG: glycosyltransferase family 4 protein [Polyangiales bacterium]